MGLEMADFIKSKIIARLARYVCIVLISEERRGFSGVCKTVIPSVNPYVLVF